MARLRHSLEGRGDELSRGARHPSLAAVPAPRPWIELDRVVLTRQLVLDGAIVSVLTALLVLVVRTTPSADYTGTHQQWGFPPCSMRVLFGIPCPGCGVTTGLAWMARGRLLDACLANLLAPVLFLVGACLWTNSLLALTMRRRIHLNLPAPLSLRLGLYAVAYATIAYAVKLATYAIMTPGRPR